MKKSKLPQAFTVIELTAVMIIIMILASLIVGVGRRARRAAMETKAESMIAALEVALSMYHSDTGTYPSNDADGSGCAEVYDELVNGTDFSGASPWRGPYMEFKSGDVVSNEIVDPWNTPYDYNADSSPNNANSFDLWSYGADETNDSGGDDDIKNW